MKIIFYLIVFQFFAYTAKTQVNQISIGASNVTVVFNSVKYDPVDGGTINIGFINDPTTGNENDCFMVKLNSSQQIVWQKVIANAGDDYLTQVIVCANGDYLAVGKLSQNGILRGFACRVNKTNGNIIWSSTSANSSSGEVFWDVIETASGNIAISGIDFLNSTNTFVVLLNSVGSTMWSKVSSFPQSDGAFSINQLPNGNLIVGATDWVGYYNAIIIEINELSGTIVTENAYKISTSLPNSGQYLNSLWPLSIKIKDGQVTLRFNSFQDCCGYSSMGLYAYDQASKQLSGNIYYHPGNGNAITYAYTPLGINDFLIAQSFSVPGKVYVSRVTNGVVVYDNLINSQVTSINSIDTTASNAVYAGQVAYNSILNSYNLFSFRNFPPTVTDCDITASNTLTLQPSTLNASAITDIILSPAAALVPSSVISQTSAFSLNTICGSALTETNKAPAVIITSPLNNANYTAPVTLTLDASASDADGSITSVKFYNGATLLYTDSISPYSYTVDSLAAGNYSFVAKATDNTGLITNSATVAVVVSVPANKAPLVYITGPANNAAYLASSTITINAAASDLDGTITSVKFYNGSTLLKTDSTAPYTYTTYNTAAGTYKFFAKATDNTGSSNSSETISIFIVSRAANKAPAVNVTSPANNATYTAPANITLTAAASDADGTITNVQFFNNGTLLATDSISPYSFSMNNVKAGNYSIVAKATDNNGFMSNSATVAIGVSSTTNKAPTVNITGPANNATYIANSTITLHATASDPDGTVTSVKFYNGTTLLKTDSTNPYSYTMSNAAAGTYKFFAKATDNKNLASSSASVSIFVVPGAAYKAPVVNIISPVNNAAYSAPATVTLNATASDTDGTITSVQFYNGSTLLKTDSVGQHIINNLVSNGNFEQGNIGFSSDYHYCNSRNCLFYRSSDGYSVGTDANFFHDFFKGHDHTSGSGNFMIINGADPTKTIWKETITVKPHTEYAFGCWIKTIFINYPAKIRFSINGTQLGSIYNAPADTSVWNQYHITWNSGANTTATIEIVDILTVSDGNNFGLDDIFFGPISPVVYSCTLTNLAAGNFSFVAKAIDNNGLITNSATVAVSVSVAPNKAPVVNLTSPANNASYTVPATITLNADANDADGTITSVKFYNGSTLLKTDSIVPYSYTMDNVPAGNYKFFAKATDNKGLANSSATAWVVVRKEAEKARRSESMINSLKPGKISINESAVIKLTPNPVHNSVNIQTTGFQNKKATITILSASGVVIKKIASINSNQKTLDVSSLVSGMYIIKIISGNEVMYKQFIKL